MAQTLLSSGYSPDYLKVLLGGYLGWENLGYPIATGQTPSGGSGAPAPGTGSQPIQVQPGATIQIQVGTPVPGGVPAPPTP